jgi:hypothetical protein
MQDKDLVGLVNRMATLFAVGTSVTGIAALVVHLTGRDELEPRDDVVMILVLLAALQLMWWFGLRMWTEPVTEHEKPEAIDWYGE